MLQHVLLASDGSEASHRAAAIAVDLARAAGARITGVHVTPAFRPSGISAHEVMREARRDLEKSREHARNVLAFLERLAQAAGIAHEGIHVVSDHPWQAIVQAATECGCDMIVMGSRGKHGLQGVLLGSQADKVLAHSRTPVLVCP